MSEIDQTLDSLFPEIFSYPSGGQMIDLDELENLSRQAAFDTREEANKQIGQRGVRPWLLRLEAIERGHMTAGDQYLLAVSPETILTLIAAVRIGQERTQKRLEMAERSAYRAEACGMAFDYGRALEELEWYQDHYW